MGTGDFAPNLVCNLDVSPTIDQQASPTHGEHRARITYGSAAQISVFRNPEQQVLLNVHDLEFETLAAFDEHI